MAPATPISMNAGQLATTWQRERSVVCKAIRAADLDVAKGKFYTPEQQQQILAALPAARPPRKQQQPATTEPAKASTPKQQQNQRKPQRQQRLATAILEPQQQHTNNIIVLQERIQQLEEKAAQQQQLLEQQQQQLTEQQQLNERIARRLKVLTDGLTRHHKAIGVLGTQVETHGALIVNLHYSLPHYPGSTDPRLRAIKIAQEQAARNAPPDAIDEGGQETLEKLATLDAENEAWLAPDGGMAKAVERQKEERAKSA